MRRHLCHSVFSALGVNMNTREFLRWVLPTEGVYVLFRHNASLGNGIKQVYFHSTDELAEAAEHYDSEGWDIYFAMSNFKEEGTRRGEDAKHIKSFFLDLDCGEDKVAKGEGFATQGDALRRLQEFCAALKLPKPLIVNSGRGIHVYWVLEESVPVEQWKVVADQFKAKCKEFGLEIDPAVPSDVARVLRVVGTHNHKPDVPAPVVTVNKKPDAVNFDFFASRLGMDTIPVPKKYTPADGPASLRDALLANVNYSFGDIVRKAQNGNGCEQLSRIITGQAETSEPMWRAGLSIAKFCVDGEEAAHKISNQHPEYTPELTLKKLNLIKGPYRCTTFDENEGGICTECPHWGKIKSPIILGRKIKEAEASEDGTYLIESGDPSDPSDPSDPIESTLVAEIIGQELSTQHVIPVYPRPYFRGQNGGVYIRDITVDGEVDEHVLYHNDLYVTRRLLDVEAGESVVCRIHLPQDGVREFTMPLTAVTSRDEFRKQMSMQGVAVPRIDDLMNYMITWVNELQATSTADTAHRQFGWVDDTYTSFIVGDREILSHEIRHNPPSTPTAATIPYFKPKGTLEAWKKMANFYNTRPELVMHQYVVCTAFGSPLMEFMPQNSCALHIHSNISGCGKTAAIRVAATVWGGEKALMIEERDTDAMKFNRAEVLHNLPFFIDELTNEKSGKLSDLAYQLSSGQQRGRMAGGANLERVRGEPWKLLSVTTGNASVIERIAIEKQQPKAEAQRMLEWKAQRVFHSTEDKEQTDVFDRSVSENYGHAGVIYIQYVMQNLEAVKALVLQFQKAVDKAAGLTAENRFWSAGAATTLAGAYIANKLELIDYDMKGLFNWTINMLKSNKQSVMDMGVSVEQTVSDYLTENYNNILMIKSTDDLRSGLGNGLDSIVIPDALPRGKLVARYETDTKKAYLVPKPLKAWCAAQQINYNAFVDDMIKKLGGKRGTIRLAKGTNFELPTSRVIIVNCKTFDTGGDTDGGNDVHGGDTGAEVSESSGQED